MRLEYSYSISESDFCNAQKLHSQRHQSRSRLGTACAWVAFTALLFNWAPTWAWVPSAVLVAYILLVKVFLPFYIWPKQYRSLNFQDCLFHAVADDDGLIVRGPDGESKSRWPAFTCYREDQHAFLLYFHSSLFMLLPKRGLSDEQVVPLRDFLDGNDTKR